MSEFDPSSVTPEAFELAVRRRAAADPGKVYKVPEVWDEDLEEFTPGYECVYVEEDQESGELVGSCLFGHALLDVGVPADWFMRQFRNTDKASNVIESLGLNFPSELKDWADDAQSEQDSNERWGLAIEKADAITWTLKEGH